MQEFPSSSQKAGGILRILLFLYFFTYFWSGFSFLCPLIWFFNFDVDFPVLPTSPAVNNPQRKWVLGENWSPPTFNKMVQTRWLLAAHLEWRLCLGRRSVHNLYEIKCKTTCKLFSGTGLHGPKYWLYTLLPCNFWGFYKISVPPKSQE